MIREVLRLEGIFTNVHNIPTLYNAWLNLHENEIVGLFGLNNSGRTTLIQILCGNILPTAGRIYRNENPVVLLSPVHAKQMGIVRINSFNSLFLDFDLTNNIFLMPENPKKFLVNEQVHAMQSQAILDFLGLHISSKTKVRDLSLVEQFIVLLARAIAEHAEIIVIEDILFTFTEDQLTIIHNILKIICKEGISILLSEHRAKTLMHLCDRIFVVREGTIASICSSDQFDEKKLTSIMIGQKIKEPLYRSGKILRNQGNPLLEWQNVCYGKMLKSFTMTIHKGQIVGLLCNNKHMLEEILAVLKIPHPTQGQILFRQRPLLCSAIYRDIFLIPENDIIYENLSMNENITLLAQKEFSLPFGIIPHSKIQMLYNELVLPHFMEELSEMRKHSIKAFNRKMRLELSLCRALMLGPSILVLINPTKLMDSPSATQILRKIVHLKERAGISILLISNNIYDQLHICDTILFTGEKRVLTQFDMSRHSSDDILTYYRAYMGR